MKYAAAILLGLLAISAAQGKSLNPWEHKAKDLEIKFEKAVDSKARAIVDKIKNVVHYAQEEAKNFVDEVEREINVTINYALKEIEVLKSEASVECYKNATKKIYAAQQAAVVNLLSCQNLSIAYQDIEDIAQNATVVISDVVNDAQLIVAGVAECGPLCGLAQYECVYKYVVDGIHQLRSQWPDAKKFIAVVGRLGYDAQRQVRACLEDPTQKSLDEKVEEAFNEFNACFKKSSQHDSYVV